MISFRPLLVTLPLVLLLGACADDPDPRPLGEKGPAEVKKTEIRKIPVTSSSEEAIEPPGTGSR